MSFVRAPAARLAVAVALVIAFTAVAPLATAGTRCPAGAGGGDTLAQTDGALRLTWIDQHQGHTAHSARVWTWGWGVGIGVATVANLVPLLFVTPEHRIDWYVGAATTAVGVVPLLIAPLDVIGDARALHTKVVAIPDLAAAPVDGVCALLLDAESLLVKDAKNQADGQRWWLHVGNVVLNTGVGLFLGIGYHHWLAGALNAVVGSAIGEAIILTQPTGTIDDLRTYRAGDLGGGPRQLTVGGAF